MPSVNLRQISAKLSPKGWAMVGGAALVFVVFAYALMSFAGKPSYTTLMAGIDPAQTGKITSALSSAGVPYELQNNGTAVAVETSKAAQARVSLAGAGLLNGQSQQPGMSLMNHMSLGESDFQQQVTYQEALEGQLAQDIEDYQGISSAQVQLVLPDSSDQVLYTGTEQTATASVLLNDSGSLGSGTAKSIADLVAGSVPGLSPSKVTVSDQTGQLLWPSTSNTSGAALGKQQAEQSYDSQMESEVDAMLASTVGIGKAEALVNADLNTNQTTEDSVTYGTKPVPLTANDSSETLGAGAASGGTVGTGIPSYAATSKGGKNSSYANTTSDTTYGVNKTVAHTVVSPGAINAQHVSVLVDKSVPAAEMPKIEQAVEAAVGYVKARGDTVTINQISFAKAPKATTAASSPTKMLGEAKYALVGLGALLFLFFMSRMLRRRENEAFAGNPTWLRELESPRSLAQIEAERAAVEDLDGPTVVRQLRSPVNVAKVQVEDLVEREPDRVASQVRAWMAED